MRTEIIKIEDYEFVDELEALSIEVNSRKELLSFMIQNNSYFTAEESFNRYHKEYQELYHQYEETKLKFQEKYIINQYNGTIKWSLNFASRELIINIQE